METHQSLGHEILNKNYARNVGSVVESKLCIGCGICEVACPTHAIHLMFDESLGVRPVVNETRCNGCKRCLYVCYGYGLNNVAFYNSQHAFLGNVINRYIGYATNENLRFDASSGGVVSALLEYALDEGLIDGATVTRMEAGNPPRAKVFIAKSFNEVLQSIGSKYCPVSFSDCLSEIEYAKKYAVVGLPCHIYGIRRLVELNGKLRNAIVLFLGILCGGMPDILGTLYVLRRYKMEGMHLEKFEYRGGGWPGRLLIRAKNSKGEKVEIKVPYPQYWNDAFGFFLPYRCTLCNDGYNRFSDASFGDAWLPELRKTDNVGTSLIITRTPKGEKLLRDAFRHGIVSIKPIGFDAAVKAQRGLVDFKFSTIRARANLCIGLRREIPLTNFSGSDAIKFSDYLQGLWFYAGNFLAHKKRFRPLFDIFVTINAFFNANRMELNKIRKRLSHK